MSLLKTLGMPFQAASLMFVAISTLLLAWTSSLGGAFLVIGVTVYWLMLVWQINFAMRMVDDAANGLQRTAAASVEMLGNPLADARAVVHPTIAAALALAFFLRPEWPVAPTLAVAALLFPASIGATTMSGHARDALNPAAMARVVRGLGLVYLPLVLFVAGCALAGVLAIQALSFLSFWQRALAFALLQLLMLLAYAGIGAALFLRRLELGFEPRRSPERVEAAQDHARTQRRQQFIDGLYRDLRVRESARATTSARQWLGAAPPAQLAGDLHAILEAGSQWQEAREYPRLLRGLLPVLLELGQPALAMTAATAGLAAHPDFAPADEATAVSMIGYALHTGRRRAATQLLDNYLRSAATQAAPGPQLQALRDTLRPTLT
ncbi:MAG: hypothetical protein ABW278_11050 [Steroidobacteraceae bacterium]